MSNGPKIILFIGIVLCISVYSIALQNEQEKGLEVAMIPVNRVDMEAQRNAGLMLALHMLVDNEDDTVIVVSNFPVLGGRVSFEARRTWCDTNVMADIALKAVTRSGFTQRFQAHADTAGARFVRHGVNKIHRNQWHVETLFALGN